MDEFAMDASVSYADLEPLIEAEVNDPLPDGLVQPEWLELPELEPAWLEEPTIEPTWLELPDLDPDWLQAIEPTEPEPAHDLLDLEQDLEH